jgi:hypothetical protein
MNNGLWCDYLVIWNRGNWIRLIQARTWHIRVAASIRVCALLVVFN